MSDTTTPSDPPPPVIPPSASPLVTESVQPAAAVETTPDDATGAPPDGPAPAPRRRRGRIIAIALLSVALAGALGALAWLLLELDSARSTIDDQQQEIEEQRELIDRKEQFGAAMDRLLDETTAFDGVLLGDIVPWDEYDTLATRAWAHRWNAELVDEDIATVREAIAALSARFADAEAQKAANTSGSVYERVLDSLGAGFVATVFDDADALCESDVTACVFSDEPHVVHVDVADDRGEWMTDWIRSGVAYHEFAHVLQFTNPVPTDVALASFDGDHETMADCFALTYLDGWTLSHRVWVSSYEYWDVDMGYGYTCTAAERQVIRDWYGQLGPTPQVLGPS